MGRSPRGRPYGARRGCAADAAGRGLSAWVELPDGNATAFAQVAQRHGVSVVPGPLLSADESHPRHLRISFAPGLAAITEGVDRLSVAWAEHAGAPADTPAAVL